MTDSDNMKGVPPIVRHVVIASILVGAFLIMASVFVPDRLQARAGEDSATHSAQLTEGLPSLGELVDNRYTVKVYATPAGPRYSVYDHDGTRVAALLSAEKVAKLYPDLPLPDARADGPLQLMDTPGANW